MASQERPCRSRSSSSRPGPPAVDPPAPGVSRRYGAHVALHETDFDLDEGELVALVGPNGAGKSTLLSVLAGALEPTTGHGRAASARPAGRRSGRLYARLTPRENLELFARLGRATRDGAVDLLVDRLPADALGRPAAVGNRQRLNVAIALLGEPRVAPARRADRRARPRAPRRALGAVAALAPRAAPSSSRPELRGDGARRPCRAPRRRAEVRPRRSHALATRLLLAKDLRVLRRSPLLLGVLLAYPLLIAVLLGLVAGYANAKPRVAFVDLDGLPEKVEIGRPDVPRRADDRRVERRRRLVRLDRGRGRAAARTARSSRSSRCRAASSPSCKAMQRSPQLELETTRGSRLARDAAGAGARLLAQPRAPGRVHRREPRVRRPDPARRPRRRSSGGEFDVLGLERAEGCST